MFVLNLLVIMSLISATTCLFLSIDMLRTARQLSNQAPATVESF